MNERIKELIKTVGTDTSGKWIGVDNAEKLADLLIRDCVGELKKEWYSLNNEKPSEEESPREVAIRIGKKTELLILIEKLYARYGL